MRLSHLNPGWSSGTVVTTGDGAVHTPQIRSESEDKSEAVGVWQDIY